MLISISVVKLKNLNKIIQIHNINLIKQLVSNAGSCAGSDVCTWYSIKPG